MFEVSNILNADVSKGLTARVNVYHESAFLRCFVLEQIESNLHLFMLCQGTNVPLCCVPSAQYHVTRNCISHARES